MNILLFRSAFLLFIYLFSCSYAFSIQWHVDALKNKIEINVTNKYNSIIELFFDFVIELDDDISKISLNMECNSDELSCIPVYVLDGDKIRGVDDDVYNVFRGNFVFIEEVGIVIDSYILVGMLYSQQIREVSLSNFESIVAQGGDSGYLDKGKVGANRNVHLLAIYKNMKDLFDEGSFNSPIVESIDAMVDVLDNKKNGMRFDEHAKSVFVYRIFSGAAFPLLHEVGHWKRRKSGFFEFDPQSLFQKVIGFAYRGQFEEEMLADKYALSMLTRFQEISSSMGLSELDGVDLSFSFAQIYMANLHRKLYKNSKIPFEDDRYTFLYEDISEEICDSIKVDKLNKYKIRGILDYMVYSYEDKLNLIDVDEYEYVKSFVVTSVNGSHPDVVSRIRSDLNSKFRSGVKYDALGLSGADISSNIDQEIRLFEHVLQGEKKEEYGEFPYTGALSVGFDDMKILAGSIMSDNIDMKYIELDVEYCNYPSCARFEYMYGSRFRILLDIFGSEGSVNAVRLYGDLPPVDVNQLNPEEAVLAYVLRDHLAEILSVSLGGVDKDYIFMKLSDHVQKEQRCEAQSEVLSSDSSIAVISTPVYSGKGKVLVTSR
jgi:hypothetical protein